MARRYRSGWWLEIKYWDEELTQREIGEECDVSASTIRKQMKQLGIPTRDMAGENHPLHGQERTEETKQKISVTLSGRSMSQETRDRMAEAHTDQRIPAEVRSKIADSLTGVARSSETRRKMSQSTAGEQNPNWKGGCIDRYGPGWSPARDRVREREDVCQHCDHDGSVRRLEVHHIVPVRVFRNTDDLSLADAHDERNLVLLCRRCHVRAEHDLIPIQPDDEFRAEIGLDRNDGSDIEE